MCKRNLDFLLHFEFLAPKTFPIGVSNDVLVAAPKSGFTQRLVDNLRTWDRFLFVK